MTDGDVEQPTQQLAFHKWKEGMQCAPSGDSYEKDLGDQPSAAACEGVCVEKFGSTCNYFIFGKDAKAGSCWWQADAACAIGIRQDRYDIYKLERQAEGYIYYEKACVTGNNIETIDDINIADCAERCNTEPSCVAFEYAVDYGGSFKYWDKRCVLQKSRNMEGCDGAKYNWDLYVKPTTTITKTTTSTTDWLDKVWGQTKDSFSNAGQSFVDTAVVDGARDTHKRSAWLAVFGFAPLWFLG